MNDLPIRFAAPNQNTVQNVPSSAGLTEQERQKAKEFEAMFLTQFVDEMMKTVDLNAATGGRDMHMWRSFMSEAMAKSLVDQGGFGLANNVENMMAAYRQGSVGESS